MKIEMTNTKPMKLPAIFYLLFLIICQTTFAQTSIQNFAPKPPLDYNSFDSYRSEYKESKGKIACFDKLFYNEDGTIPMIGHTI